MFDRSNPRYSSPFVSSTDKNAQTVRRSSNGSINTFGTNNSALPPDSAQKRRVVNSSPLRASYGGNPNPPPLPSANPSVSAVQRPASPSISSKRFSTPTPQSGQHHDYENLSATTNARVMRSSTPTKATWKF